MSVVNKSAVLLIEQNATDIYITGVEILLKLLDNVIKEPENPNFRTIRLGNEIIKGKLLCVNGIKELLSNIGFIENNGNLILPPTVLIAKIKNYRQFLANRREKLKEWSPATVARIETANEIIQSSSESVIKVMKIPTKRSFLERTTFSKLVTSRNPFLQLLEHLSDQVMQYNDENLLSYGKSIIPLEKLKLKALNKLRAIQKAIISNNYREHEPCINDLILVELVNWFNSDFFKWVNNIPCKVCKQGKVKAIVKTEKYGRAEVVQCCGQETKFYRFNDIAYLLLSRRGRCGEYANCFTFICKCLGYDARYVYSTFDHVWTEVYSVSQQRWVHIDPSENVVDSPLMYQHGWKREIDYVVAFLDDDVQDVTWRYTNNHTNTLALRKMCTEKELLNTLLTLRNKKQLNISSYRKMYLKTRIIKELFELMIEREPTEDERKGRSSGSLNWRQQRGEYNTDNFFLFELNESEVNKKEFNLRYSSVNDKYERYFKDNVHLDICGEYQNWITCTYNCKNIFRKVERDWKMVYLTREEGTEHAEVTWKFDFSKSKMLIKNYSFRFDKTCYESGEINVIMIPENGMASLIGSSGFSIVATLHGGNGDIAWQHTQLFRQNLNSCEYPFEINISFK